jgi:hypothetical protein
MKCFYHPTTDAVGLCSQCQKAGCRSCMSDIGGALLCVSCVQWRWQQEQQHAAYMQTQANSQQAVMAAKARSAIRNSWIYSITMTVISTILLLTGTDGNAWVLVLAPITLYVNWSTYWVWKPVFRRWRKAVSGLGCFVIGSPMLIIFVLLTFSFYIPAAIAGIYGFFGGGIVEYLKYRKMAKGQSLMSQTQYY